MATWDKDTVFITLVNSSNGEDDTTSHTVKLQPIDQAYDTGSVSCSQMSGNQARYKPDSDLDSEMHYDVYVDDTRVGRLIGIDSVPAIGA